MWSSGPSSFHLFSLRLSDNVSLQKKLGNLVGWLIFVKRTKEKEQEFERVKSSHGLSFLCTIWLLEVDSQLFAAMSLRMVKQVSEKGFDDKPGDSPPGYSEVEMEKVQIEMDDL